MTVYAQIFCTLAELEQALKSNGAEREGFYLPKIKAVSRFMLMDFGNILPVTMVRSFNGRGKERLFIPNLLEVTSIVNDGTSLTAADYVEQPDNGHWQNGPYSMIERAHAASLLSCWADYEEGVVITGKWGLYNLLASLGITLGAAQTDSATLIQVSNGAEVSPGMVVVIGTEQEYIESTSSTPVTGVTTITEPITDINAQQITLQSAAALNIGEVFRIDLEKMRLLDKNETSNIAYVDRGWDNSIKASHLDNAVVDVYRKFNVVRGVNGTTAAAHDRGASISRQTVPEDIKELCVKMTARSIRDGEGGYQGVVGDPNTGSTKYLFPKPFEYEEILDKYRIRMAG